MKKNIQKYRSFLSAAVVAILATLIVAPAGAGAAFAQKKPAAKPAPKAAVKAPASIYNQGYLKGYTEGFAQGSKDWSNSVPRDFQRADAFQGRKQGYAPTLSESEEYDQGFKLGFEMGHTDGYYGRAKNITVPVNGQVLAKAAALADAQRLARRSERDADANRDQQRPSDRDRDQQRPSDRDRDRRPSDRDQNRDRDRDQTRPRTYGSVTVPAGSELRLKLTSPIDTKNNRIGDKFTAIVLTPAAYQDATIEGHIATLKKSGKVTGKTELGLAFDTITMPDGRRGELPASLERIIESETVKKVDAEGNVESGSRSRDSQVRGAAGGVAGAVIGGIVGGGKGALLGAILGGAAGVGTVAIEGNKDLTLDPGTEMVIRTERRQ